MFIPTVPLGLVGWTGFVLLVVTARAALMPVPLSLAEVGGWLLLLVVPPALGQQIFRGPSTSIAGVLYDTEHAGLPTPQPVSRSRAPRR